MNISTIMERALEIISRKPGLIREREKKNEEWTVFDFRDWKFDSFRKLLVWTFDFGHEIVQIAEIKHANTENEVLVAVTEVINLSDEIGHR